MLLHTHGDTTAATATATLHDFFMEYSLPQALHLLEQIITAACSKTSFRTKAPYQVLYFLQHLQQLTTAAATLQQRPLHQATAILPAGQEATGMQAQHYCTHPTPANAWHCFPRQLSPKQYCNPYRVLRRFTKQYPAAKAARLSAALAEHALSNYAFGKKHHSRWVLQMRRRLLQLVEACHLIYVRTKKPAKAT